MSRGTCCGNPRISMVARVNIHGSPRKFRGHCHGTSPKSPIMCIGGEGGAQQKSGGEQRLPAADTRCRSCLEHVEPGGRTLRDAIA